VLDTNPGLLLIHPDAYLSPLFAADYISAPGQVELSATCSDSAHSHLVNIDVGAHEFRR